MEQIKSILVTLLCACMLGGYAQTQHGYVKTLGRPEQKGAPLAGVTVMVKGGHGIAGTGTSIQ